MRDLEDTAVMKKEMSTYTPEMLGYNASNYTAKAYREKRFSVLDKVSRLGQGLSPAQRTDFAWWKEAWDEMMLEEHEEDWGQVFAMHVQCVLDEMTVGRTNAFSVLVHIETIRLVQSPALRL